MEKIRINKVLVSIPIIIANECIFQRIPDFLNNPEQKKSLTRYFVNSKLDRHYDDKIDLMTAGRGINLKAVTVLES